MPGREDVARAQWRELLPTAYLLTGDQTAARRLVVRTLARTRRGADPADRDAAVTALVRTHRSRWVVTGRTSIQGDPPAPWWASPADVAAAHRLAAELDALDRDERTAVVLRWAEDRSPERVAALLPHVDTDALLTRIGVDPADLPRRLDDLAGLADPAALDDDEVVAAVREVSGRRARRTGLAAATLAAVVALGVWVPGVAVPGDDSTAAPTTAARTPVDPPLTGIFALPERGSLAGDDDLLAGMQRRLSEQGLRGEDYRLSYGADVGDVRVALLVRPGPSQVSMAWLTGPAGTSPTDLTVVQDADSGPGGSTAAAVLVEDPTGRAAQLVVLTEDGTGVRVSTGVDVDPASGSVSRSFVDVPSPDGVGSVVLDRGLRGGLRLQVDPRDGDDVELSPVSSGTTYLFPDAGGPPVPSRSGSPTASAFVVQVAVDAITSSTGWSRDDLDVVVLGAGTVPVPGGDELETVAVAAVLPGGAVVTTTASGSISTSADGSTTSTYWGSCGSSSYPAGTDPAGLVVAATCLLGNGPTEDGSRTVVVAAPPGHPVVLGYPDDGATITPDLVNGFGSTTYVAARDLSTATDGGAVFPVAGPAHDALLD